jgi:arabinogalactan endo-1,4-beta-galactosidase
MPWTDSVACKAFITDVINKVKSVNDHKGLGVLYWEPESYNNWKGYTQGTFNNSGKPTIGLDSFK